MGECWWESTSRHCSSFTRSASVQSKSRYKCGLMRRDFVNFFFLYFFSSDEHSRGPEVFSGDRFEVWEKFPKWRLEFVCANQFGTGRMRVRVRVWSIVCRGEKMSIDSPRGDYGLYSIYFSKWNDRKIKNNYEKLINLKIYAKEFLLEKWEWRKKIPVNLKWICIYIYTKRR